MVTNDELIIDSTSNPSGVFGLVRVGPVRHVRVVALATGAAFDVMRSAERRDRRDTGASRGLCPAGGQLAGAYRRRGPRAW